MNRIAKVLVLNLVGLFFVGCGNQQTTPQDSGPDPIQQQIETKVKKQGAKEVPPGYMMNSGGELVPVDDTPQSDQ